jgi:hypothetical protein
MNKFLVVNPITHASICVITSDKKQPAQDDIIPSNRVGYSLLLQCYQACRDPNLVRIPFTIGNDCQKLIDKGGEPLLDFGREISEYNRRLYKPRKSEADKAKLYRLELVTEDQEKASRSGRDSKQQRLPASAIESILLCRKAGLSISETAKKLGMAKSTVCRHQKALREAGRL